MTLQPIEISALIAADSQRVWECYTQPDHITKWNFADPSWHCPYATNEMKIGGRYLARMEAKDGSFGFDFEAIYTEITPGSEFRYAFGGRTVHVKLHETNGQTTITIVFDPEQENSIELQEKGWQAILNNFKSYVENK